MWVSEKASKEFVHVGTWRSATRFKAVKLNSCAAAGAAMGLVVNSADTSDIN